MRWNTGVKAEMLCSDQPRCNHPKLPASNCLGCGSDGRDTQAGFEMSVPRQVGPAERSVGQGSGAGLCAGLQSPFGVLS